MNSTG